MNNNVQKVFVLCLYTNLLVCYIFNMNPPEARLKQQPVPFSTMFLDMDSFFASVEQYYDPKLRGRPVGVATGQSNGASIIAASIEAKQFGVRGGVRVGDALSKCPQLVVVHDSPNSYRAIHRQIMDVLHATPCYVRAKSIDEAYMLIPSYMRSRHEVLALAKAIKSNIFDLYNEYISCSIGVASNIWLAKMGSNYQKPRGLVVLEPQMFKNFYKSISLLALTGINTRMARRLYTLGIYSPYDLYCASASYLRRNLGVNGEKWYLRLRGFEVDYGEISPNKSIGHQITTVPNSPRTIEEITTFINKIAVTLGNRLRNKSLKASGMYIGLSFMDHTGWGNVVQHTKAFRSDYQIMMLAKTLLKKLDFVHTPVRKIYVTLFNLTDELQTELPLEPEVLKYEALAEAVDEVNDRYGKNTLMPLRSFYAGYANLNRVGFAGDLIREKANPTDKKHYV